MSTEDPMSIEDRVRTATRAGASLIRDVRPLGAPAPVRLRRHPGPAPRRWVSWAVPLAAAAAVAAIALTLVAIRQPGTPSPAASGSGTAAPATIPRYYAYASSVHDASTGKWDGPVIVGDDLTGKVIATVSQPPGLAFTSVRGTSDDRTFVVMAAVNSGALGSPPYTWYLLRVTPGSAQPYQLTKLPIKRPDNALVSAYALSPDGRELAVESHGSTGLANTLGVYSVSTGAQLHAWTAPAKSAAGMAVASPSWLPGGQQLVFSTIESTAASAYQVQLRALDVKETGTDLLADSRILLTVNNSGASACESLQITPDGGTAVCATWYDLLSGPGSNAGCPNGLRFIAFSLTAPRHSRDLYQYRGACTTGELFTLWTDASARSVIGAMWINPNNPNNDGTNEARQVGVITGGHFRALNIAKSVPPSAYMNLAF